MPRPFSSYSLPHQPTPTSAWYPRSSSNPFSDSERNCTPLLPSFLTSFKSSASRKSSPARSLTRNVLCGRPLVRPTISPFSTDHKPGSPDQPASVRPLKNVLAFSFVASIGTCDL